MTQWRMILAVVVVALGAAAIWAWQEGSQHEDATLTRAVPAAPVRQPQPPAADQAALQARQTEVVEDCGISRQ